MGNNRNTGVNMKTVYGRRHAEVAEQIRTALIEDGEVTVVSEYETFYGAGFDRWIAEQVKDLNAVVEVIAEYETGYGRIPETMTVTIQKQ